MNNCKHKWVCKKCNLTLKLIRHRKNQSYVNYETAKKYAGDHQIKSSKVWRNSNLPNEYPKNPNLVYKKQWINWYDFLDIGFLPLEICKKFARSTGITTIREWKEVHKRGFFPEGIPSSPEECYTKRDWSWAK